MPKSKPSSLSQSQSQSQSRAKSKPKTKPATEAPGSTYVTQGHTQLQIETDEQYTVQGVGVPNTVACSQPLSVKSATKLQEFLRAANGSKNRAKPVRNLRRGVSQPRISRGKEVQGLSYLQEAEAPGLQGRTKKGLSGPLSRSQSNLRGNRRPISQFPQLRNCVRTNKPGFANPRRDLSNGRASGPQRQQDYGHLKQRQRPSMRGASNEVLDYPEEEGNKDPPRSHIRMLQREGRQGKNDYELAEIYGCTKPNWKEHTSQPKCRNTNLAHSQYVNIQQILQEEPVVRGLGQAQERAQNPRQYTRLPLLEETQAIHVELAARKTKKAREKECKPVKRSPKLPPGEDNIEEVHMALVTYFQRAKQVLEKVESTSATQPALETTEQIDS